MEKTKWKDKKRYIKQEKIKGNNGRESNLFHDSNIRGKKKNGRKLMEEPQPEREKKVKKVEKKKEVKINGEHKHTILVH